MTLLSLFAVILLDLWMVDCGKPRSPETGRRAEIATVVARMPAEHRSGIAAACAPSRAGGEPMVGEPTRDVLALGWD